MAIQTIDPSQAVIKTVGTATNGGTATSSTPVITGTADAGNIVTVYDGIKILGTTTAQSDGTWSFTVTTALKGGAHTFAAIPKDSAGNIGASSQTVSMTIPAGPAPATPAAPTLTDDNGTGIANGSTTADNHPHISGTGTAGDTIKILDNGTVIGSTTIAANGTWTYPSTNLPSGTNAITVIETNPAGMSSGTSPSTTVTVNTSTPATPAAPTLTDDSDKSIPAGSTTTDGHPHISGTGSTAGDVIKVYDGSTLLGSTTVAANGTWTFTPSADVSTGTHNINVTDTNAAGTSSAHSADTAFTFATVPTETVLITSLTDHTSGASIPAGSTSSDIAPIVHGTVSSSLLSGETLEVYRDGVAIGPATMNGTTWSYNDSAVAAGSHTYTAKVQNSVGSSTYSPGFSFTEAEHYTGTGGQVSFTNSALNGYIIEKFDFTGVTLPAGDLWIVMSANSAATGILGHTAGGNNVVWTVGINAADMSNPTQTYTFYFVPTGSSIGGKGSTLIAQDTLKNIVAMNAAGTSEPFLNSPVQATQAVKSVHEAQPTVGAEQSVGTTISADSQHAASPAPEAAVAATTGQSAVTEPAHTVVGAHDSFVGATGHDTVDLNADPASYFKESTAHIQGSTVHPTEPVGTTPAANTLHLTGDHQVLDLTSLTGQTAAAKISGIEVIDLGGHTNNLKLSLTDVLNLGEQDLFQTDGHRQMMVNGSNGDTVDLSNSHIAGVANGVWEAEGTATVGGVMYNVYEHTGAHTELLVQQGVQVALHN